MLDYVIDVILVLILVIREEDFVINVNFRRGNIMDDVLFNFKGRKYPRSFHHIRIHYSKSDEEISIKIIDRKRFKNDGGRDSSRLNEIYLDMIQYFIDRADTEIIL